MFSAKLIFQSAPEGISAEEDFFVGKIFGEERINAYICRSLTKMSVILQKLFQQFSISISSL